MEDNIIIPSNYQPSKDNRYIFYEFLHFIPKQEKDKYWAAQCLLFNKFNAERMIPLAKIQSYRALDRGIIDKQQYVNIIDPPQPDGTGGQASYFASSWQPNPINIHLKNILEAKLDKIPVSLFVKAADEYFQSNQQKENSRIIGRRSFLRLINEINADVGLPKLRSDEDPFKYVNQMAAAMEQGKVKTADAPGGGGATDTKRNTNRDLSVNLMDSIKNMIEDNEDLALFNTYIYKDGVEVACELGMDYYMEVNKWTVANDKTKADLRNFNCSAARFYTSKTTGRPVLEHLDLDSVWTSPFYKEDGSDILFWWREYDVTFGEFVRQFGADLSKEELKLVFDRSRSLRGNWNTGTGRTYEACTPLERENAMIRIGYMEWMTQDMEVYSEGNIRGNTRFKQMPGEWYPKKNSAYSREERYYNCWYKCYYIPAFVSTAPQTWQTSDFELQAQFIFDYGPLQDQFREGDDERYSRSSLVVWRSIKPSWTDIEQKFMPKINLLWMQFENDLGNALPHGMFFSEEAFTEMMDVVDEAQNSGKDNNIDAIRRLKQTGYGVGKLFTDLGARIPPFVEIKTAHLQTAQERLTVIMDLYAMMVRAFGMNEITEGAGPKPRQSLGAIEQAMNISNNATYFIEKGFLDIYKELGFRLLAYFREVVQEGDSERLREFQDIVGQANAWALEAIKDIPYRKLAVLVDAINTDEQNSFLNQMAMQMATGQNPLISPDEAIELTFIQNVKYKFALLRLKINKGRRDAMANQQQLAEAGAAAAQQEFQMRMAEIQAKIQGQAQLTDLIKQWDGRLLQMEAQLKYMSQSQIKEQIKDNRIEQDTAKMEMEKNSEQQASLV